VLETLIPVLLVKGGGRLLAAAVEGRDLAATDASSVTTALLEALVEGNARTTEQLDRLQGTIDRLAEAPHEAAVTAGQRLLRDAAPAHRTAADRRQLLADARTRFADAIGHARDRRQRAHGEVLYGLTWLAAGSPTDAVTSFTDAAGVLEDELLATFAAAVAADTAYVRAKLQRNNPLGRLTDYLVGPPTGLAFGAEAGGAFDQWFLARTDHTHLQGLRTTVGTGDAGAPALIPAPLGTVYSQPGAALRVALVPGLATGIFGVTVTMTAVSTPDGLSATVHVRNRRSEPVHVTVGTAGADMYADTRWLAPFARSWELERGSAAGVTSVAPGTTTELTARLDPGPSALYAVTDVRVGPVYQPLGHPRFTIDLPQRSTLLRRGFPLRLS
jgi:hypothetical protein